MASANLSPQQQEHLPLRPQPLASPECLVGRLDRIYYLLRRMGFSDDAATSGCDAALLKGLEALTTGKAERMSPRHRAAWLWIWARGTAVRTARQEMRNKYLTYDPEDRRMPAVDHENPNATAVWQAIEQLPERQRAAVTLCFIESLSRAEAAEIMGISVATVCRRLSDAFVRLRKELASLGNLYSQ